jgi:hypothetical protein
MVSKETRIIKDAARTWLTEHQDESGGWAERPGGSVNVLNTAEVMLALFASGVDAGNPSIGKAVEFLLAHGRDVPEEDRGAWGRNVQHENSVRHIPDIVRTALAVRAMVKAGRKDEDEVKDAIAWLLSRENSKKEGYGWAYKRNGKSDFMPTCFALQALLEAYGAGAAPGLETPIKHGLTYLVDKQNKALGFFGGSDPMMGVRTIAAVLTLQAAARCKLSVYAAEEKLGIQWVLENPTQSRAVVEELATIDPNGEGDYGLLYMPKLLTVRFEGLPSEAVRELLIDFDENFDDASGGFYGRRIFSWATAQALQALSASQLETLPQPEPVFLPEPVEPERVSATVKLGVSLGFLVIFTVTIVLLAIKQILSLVAATLLVIVLYAFLLTYGAIREGTFKDLVLAAPKMFQGTGKESDTKRNRKKRTAN